MNLLHRLLSALALLRPARRYPHAPEVGAVLKAWIPADGRTGEAANDNRRSKAAAP